MNEAMIPCPHCGLMIGAGSNRCLYCKREVTTRYTADLSKPPGLNQEIRQQPRQNLLWAGLGVLAAGILVPLGGLLILSPLETARQVGGEGSDVSLAFSLLGCVLGIFLSPLAGILGGRGGFSLRNAYLDGYLGAFFGGAIYASLVIIFGLLNLSFAT